MREGGMRASEALAADEEGRCTNSLAGLAAVLLIVVLSAVVIRKLQVRCMLETCLISQQQGCEMAIDRLRVSRFMERAWSR